LHVNSRTPLLRFGLVKYQRSNATLISPPGYHLTFLPPYSYYYLTRIFLHFSIRTTCAPVLPANYIRTTTIPVLLLLLLSSTTTSLSTGYLSTYYPLYCYHYRIHTYIYTYIHTYTHTHTHMYTNCFRSLDYLDLGHSLHHHETRKGRDCWLGDGIGIR